MKSAAAALVIFLGSGLTARPQTPADSLEKLEKQAVHERDRAHLSLRIIRAKLQANDTIGLRSRILTSEQLAEKLRDSVLLYYVVASKGDLQFMSRKSHRGFDDYFRAFQLARAIGTDSIMADAYYNLGHRNYLLGNYVPALDKLLRARDVYTRTGNANKVAIINRLCGVVHLTMGSVNEALQLFNESKLYWQKIHDDRNLASTLNNIGLAYMNMGDSLKSMEFFYQSLVLREKTDDKVGMGQVCNNIGTLLFKLGHYDKALSYYKKGYELRKNYNGPRQGQLESLVNIGKAHFAGGDLNQAREYLESAYSMALEDGNLELQRRALDVLKDLYAKNGDHKKAFDAQKEFYALRDSLFSYEKTEDLIRLSASQEYERKMMEDSLKTAEREKQEKALSEEKDKRQSIIRNAMLAGLLLLVGIAFLLFKRNRERKQANDIITEQRDQLSMKQVEITDSIQYAQRIQMALLPSPAVMEETFPASFILYLPRDIVSGDFYWTHTSPDGHLLLAAVDCTGHGVPGAMVSVVGYNALNRCVNEFGLRNPAAILDKLNELVDESFSRSGNTIRDGMDISVCCIHPGRTVLEWAGANNPLWILRGREILEFKADKQPIGRYIEHKPFTCHRIAIEKKDRIYLFTDGYADQFGGPRGKKFKYRQLKELLLDLSEKSMHVQKEVLSEAFEKWKGRLEQVDDVCIIGVCVSE
jgi:serine phosphatase RsbU (regulator of sigma subunit)/Tfp pilus assembly protein PilF